eukprot:Awhi_evm1s6346
MQLTKIICAAVMVASVALVDQVSAQSTDGCELFSTRRESSRSACERRCDRTSRCDVFRYSSSSRRCRVYDCDSDRASEENERQNQILREEGEENAKARENDPNAAQRARERELDRQILRTCTQIGRGRATSESGCDRACENFTGCEEGVFDFFSQRRCTFHNCGPNAADFISDRQAEQNERNSDTGR